MIHRRGRSLHSPLGAGSDDCYTYIQYICTLTTTIVYSAVGGQVFTYPPLSLLHFALVDVDALMGGLSQR